jgi:hypothetical protein
VNRVLQAILPGNSRVASLALVLLLPIFTAATAGAQEAATPEAPPKPATHPATQVILDALGSVSIGVAWQATEFDITPDSDCCTISMTNGLEPTPLLYAQIPVRILWGDGRSGIGYTVRAGYRRFVLKEQDLGGAGEERQDYGTRVSGRAMHVTPFLVARAAMPNQELAAGLGIGIGHFKADGDTLVRRLISGPPFTSVETEPVHVSAFSSTLGAFAEYRIGPIVAAMETAIFLASKGGKSYDLGISAFTLAWRVDF